MTAGDVEAASTAAEELRAIADDVGDPPLGAVWHERTTGGTLSYSSVPATRSHVLHGGSSSAITSSPPTPHST